MRELKRQKFNKNLCVVLIGFCFFTDCGKKSSQTASNAPPNADGKTDAAATPGQKKGTLGSPPKMDAVTIAPPQPTASDILKANPAATDPDGDHINFRYQWYKNGKPLSGEVQTTLSPGAYARGDNILCEVIPSDNYFDGAALRSAPVVIVNAPPRIENAHFAPEKPDKKTGLKIEMNAVDPDADPLTYKYEWFENGKPVATTTEPIFPPETLKKKTWIIARITVSDGFVKAEKELKPIATANSAPEIMSSPAEMTTGTTVYTYAVKARDADNDPLTYAVSGVDGATISKEGVVTWTPDPKQNGQNKLRVTVTDDDGGSTYQEFEIRVAFKQ